MPDICEKLENLLKESEGKDEVVLSKMELRDLYEKAEGESWMHFEKITNLMSTLNVLRTNTYLAWLALKKGKNVEHNVKKALNHSIQFISEKEKADIENFSENFFIDGNFEIGSHSNPASE